MIPFCCNALNSALVVESSVLVVGMNLLSSLLPLESPTASIAYVLTNI